MTLEAIIRQDGTDVAVEIKGIRTAGTPEGKEPKKTLAPGLSVRATPF